MVHKIYHIKQPLESPTKVPQFIKAHHESKDKKKETKRDCHLSIPENLNQVGLTQIQDQVRFGEKVGDVKHIGAVRQKERDTTKGWDLLTHLGLDHFDLRSIILLPRSPLLCLILCEYCTGELRETTRI